jgi:hypothetical protein
MLRSTMERSDVFRVARFRDLRRSVFRPVIAAALSVIISRLVSLWQQQTRVDLGQ